ncbi:unnamed protein product [Nippostrongylus brasiliensis]|uniref:Integrase catalytic domain-containing protein n=1 Tax=Nippostrongylus brasiliensis TaxID=27835 RepID=A0A0N4YSY5_NIPBR|nr:unnamed protein product [Nippostrongylus brasiliensis]
MYSNKLQQILSRLQEEKLETIGVSDGNRSSQFEQDSWKRLQEELGILEEYKSRVEEALEKYAYAYDQLEQQPKSEMDDYELYSGKAEEALSSALDYAALLKGRLCAFTSNTRESHLLPRSSESEQTTQDFALMTKRVDLPTLPIPVFSGNVWDWDNFWILFSTNVHSQNLPPIFKFNYLLNSLKGEAYSAVKKFQITDENYQKAVEFLHAKYGDPETLISQLIDRLENITARSTAVKDQRVLLEQIQVIVSQLRDKGDQVDGQSLLKQILSKFSDRFQRRVWEKKYTKGTGMYLTMDVLLRYLDEIISSEEKIEHHTSRKIASPLEEMGKERKDNSRSNRGSSNAAFGSCMYCGNNHRKQEVIEEEAQRETTPKERVSFLPTGEVTVQNPETREAKKVSTPPILQEDIAFIETLNLPINLVQGQKTTKPKVLLGCDQLWNLVRKDQTQIQMPSGLYLLPTHFGHLLTGQIHSAHQINQVTDQFHHQDECFPSELNKARKPETPIGTFTIDDVGREANEEAFWEKLWTIEQDGIEKFAQPETQIQSLTDKKVMENFRKTIEKRSDGYYVRLPWKETPTELPDNRAIALRRLMGVWTSLQRDKELLDKYNNTFQEQLKLGIIEEVTNEYMPVEGKVHYLPHQAVLTPHKNTTKLRIVFDASAHFKNSQSLNDALHRGPIILPKLFGLLLRFRIGGIALISDVEKAFLQVRLHQIDRDATRCLWLNDFRSPPETKNIKVFRFTRVTFGLLSSPFLLAATTHYHLDQYSEEADLITEVKQNLYVDNLILTTDAVEEAIHVYHRTKTIFNESNMNLREFASNDERVLERMSQTDISSEMNPKVLGIRWYTKRDQLGVECKVAEPTTVTKRSVTRAVASVYDPMGWMLPLLHKAKIFIQSLWKEDLNWDTPLPKDHKEKWELLIKNMNGFQKEIPRFLVEKLSRVQLVTFADASSEAMATCTYLCSEKSVELLMAKGKLAPLKTKMTIPKMELNALTLAVRLSNAVTGQLRQAVSINNVLILTDSEIALNWIRKKSTGNQGQFVKNRVFEIHSIIDELKGNGYSVSFGHIPSNMNPADCATRGLDNVVLKDHFWWKGPKFLSQSIQAWGTAYKAIDLDDRNSRNENTNDITIEHDEVNILAQAEENYEDLFDNIRFSKFSSVIRVVAYVMRFIANITDCTNKKRKDPIILSSILRDFNPRKFVIPGRDEMKRANKLLVKQHQLSHLSNTIQNSLHRLNLFKDDDGIVRCRGRLGKSNLSESAKYPMLILQKSKLSKRIIMECHNDLHTSTNHTMCRVREMYWIPQLRAEVTKIIRKCVNCQKMNNLPYKYPEQSDLPSRRVKKSRPFAHVGLDYFGPLSVKEEDQVNKCYGCIITCLVTRLVHLDIVTDASTTTFIQMLRRFFSRRGVPSSITCDNSPTFSLGGTILSEFFQQVKQNQTIQKEMSNRHIDWIYITPFAPWQGGVYERLIQSIKKALYKTIGKTITPREELTTLIIEIEGMLNTRPLLHVESESVSEGILRPIDFLQNEFEVPPSLNIDEDYIKNPDYISSSDRVGFQTKLQALQALQNSCQRAERFWQIWQSQYLTSLREKHQREVGKKRGSYLQPQEGEIVLICDANQPRYQWKMGRISALVKNAEGIIREAVILLPSKRKIRRPVNLLIPLEMEENKGTSRKKKTPKLQESSESISSEEDKKEQNNDEKQQTSHYNLRSHRKANFKQSRTTSLQINAMTIVLVTVVNVLSTSCSELTSIRSTNQGKQAIEGMSGKMIDGNTTFLSRIIRRYGSSEQEIREELNEILEAFEGQCRAGIQVPKNSRHFERKDYPIGTPVHLNILPFMESMLGKG